MFPKARTSLKAAHEAGVKIAVGTDAPAIPHGRNADELVTLVDWGMPPAAVLRAATVVAADPSHPSRRSFDVCIHQTVTADAGSANRISASWSAIVRDNGTADIC